MLLEKVNTGTFAIPKFLKILKLENSSVRDRLLLYNFEDKQPRIVMPTRLRPSILVYLCKTNQGSTSIIERAIPELHHDLYITCILAKYQCSNRNINK